jgi:uncharacterized repeat protein (TIGR02543 family)
MTAAQTVTATFTLNPALTVTKSGTGTGTVTSSPAGINCGSDCTEPYAYNTAVTLTATAGTGFTFTGWGGACSGTGTTCTVTVDGAKSVTATFATTPSTQATYTLTVRKAGNARGTVTSSLGGINCGRDCRESYPAGNNVILTATPATGSVFAGWSGACTGTSLNCMVTLNQSTSVTATFKRMYRR